MKDATSIIIKVCNTCNLRCKHCYEGDEGCDKGEHRDDG